MSAIKLIAGRYELGEMIGSGGMGDVYRGTDIYTNRAVAIKWLNTAIIADNPNLVDRFRREGEALNRLDHPSIVNMLDTVDEDGQHYLIMEFVSGGSLRDLLDRDEKLPIDRALNIALDLADALTRAHRLNIIHRDIKPDNVLIAEDGTPRLTDFGVAHMADRTRLTQTGSVIGTYAYLSPEACHGLDLDERADIWSFGVMLYEMLAGCLPFDEMSTAALLTAILTKPAPDLARERPDLPPELVDLVSRMLEKDRERRLGSVRLVGAELEALLRRLEAPSVTESSVDQARSRFATPSDPGVPAMERSIPGQTHGLLLYPAPEEAQTSSETVPVPRLVYKWQWIALTVGIVVIACAAIIITAIIFRPEANQIMLDKTATANARATAAANSLVQPVAPGEYMVLVANFEQFGPEPRVVTRFIIDNLRQALEIGVPFSQIRIREYPDVITSQSEARAAAEANDAAVIVWGNYTPNTIEAEVQIGSTLAFKSIGFDRAVLERTANVRVRLTHERRQSVAKYVLGVLSILHSADGNGFETMRTIAISEQVNVASGEVLGTSVAAYIHDRFQSGLENPTRTLEQIDAAIDLDAGNALLYTERCIINQQLGHILAARRDAETAKRLGPSNWTMPLLLLANMTQNSEEVLSLFGEVIELRPDDWFPLFFRGAIYFEMGEFDLARADLDKAISLDPSANFPYIYTVILAMREGRVSDAGAAIRTILDEFPDPSYLSRLIRATFGQENLGAYSSMLSAFGNLVLGRYREAVEVTIDAVRHYGYSTDLYTMQGFGYCGLEAYAAAESSYDEGIKRDPEFMLAYLLRAEVRLKQDKVTEANADFQVIAGSPQAAAFVEAVEAVKNGDLGCTTFFTDANPMLQTGTGAIDEPVSGGDIWEIWG